MNSIKFPLLPFFARSAISHQDCLDHVHRTIQQLDVLLDLFAEKYGETCSIMVRRSCHDIQICKHKFSNDSLIGYVAENAPTNLEPWQRIIDQKLIGITPVFCHCINASVEINGIDHFAKLNLRDRTITMFKHPLNQEAKAFFETHFLEFHMLSYLYSLSNRPVWTLKQAA